MKPCAPDEHVPELVETIRVRTRAWTGPRTWLPRTREVRILRCRRCHEPLYDVPASARGVWFGVTEGTSDE